MNDGVLSTRFHLIPHFDRNGNLYPVEWFEGVMRRMERENAFGQRAADIVAEEIQRYEAEKSRNRA